MTDYRITLSASLLVKDKDRADSVKSRVIKILKAAKFDETNLEIDVRKSTEPAPIDFTLVGSDVAQEPREDDIKQVKTTTSSKRGRITKVLAPDPIIEKEKSSKRPQGKIETAEEPIKKARKQRQVKPATRRNTVSRSAPKPSKVKIEKPAEVTRRKRRKVKAKVRDVNGL